MVFTRVLTLKELSTASYYGYIAAYCLIYVLPMFAIVVAFATTLGRRKLTEQEGRTLKLLSGLMMAGLGLVLIIQPDLLNQLSTTLGLLGGVLVLTYVLHHAYPTHI